ncbi:MAG: DUF2804 domain-containing protein [Christensenellales bacterium]
MTKYPDYISPKREPVKTPDSIVENGQVHFGTFDAPFKNLNLLDCKKPCGKKMPDSMKKGRLVEWEAFEVHFDEGALISAVYNTGPMGFSIFVWYDKKEDKIYSWRNLVPKKKAKVAAQLIDDYCYCKTSKSEYRIDNDFLNGKAAAKGYSKGRSGSFEIDVKFERVSPLANGVMPLAKNKDGSFRNALYSEKDFFKATGTITVNGKTYTSNERSVGIIDDHKGYYPFKAHYDWLTTMGVLNDGGKERLFAFNLTRNQSVDQDSYNENVIWVEGESFPMPPVKFTHKNGKKKAKEWYVKDEKGLVDITFKINKVYYSPIHALVIDCYYALPYGYISGYVTDTNGKKYVVDGMLGIGEDKTTRM